MGKGTISWLSSLVLLLSACAESPADSSPTPARQDAETLSDLGAPGPDTRKPALCAYLDDGVCDEPVNCPLGSDEVDCASACQNPERLWLLGAACAHRSPPIGPAQPPATTPGNTNTTGSLDRSLDVPLGDGSGSRARHYRLVVPPQYDPALAWPLVIMMPGHRVDIYSLADYTQLEPVAEANGFLLVYAEQEWRSNGFRWAWWTDWNWVQKPDSNPDIAFLQALVNDVASGWSIDRSRVYGVGHSRGGAMAYIAAFELSQLFAAVCSQSGFTEFGYADHVAGWTGRNTPVMLVHGVLDTDVGVGASDAMETQLKSLGWAEGTLVYHRLQNVAHRWQPWLNQEMWDFLSAHELPEVLP